MRANFGCSQTVVSKKGGYRQTDTQRDTAAFYSRCAVDIINNVL